MNINRGVVLLIWDTHSHLWSALVEKRSSWRRRRIRLWYPCWFYLLSFWGIYIEEAFAGFFPLGFCQDKSVLFLWYCFFQWSCLYAFCYENEMKYWCSSLAYENLTIWSNDLDIILLCLIVFLVLSTFFVLPRSFSIVCCNFICSFFFLSPCFLWVFFLPFFLSLYPLLPSFFSY